MPQSNTNQARELARNSSDCSFLLSHLVRQNTGKSDAEARAILESILDASNSSPQPLLRASKTGWYGRSTPFVFNPVSMKLEQTTATSAVCFTESTLAGLKAHRDIFQVEYGLAFDREHLFSKGANPCLNIRDPLLRTSTSYGTSPTHRHLYNFIPLELHPFVNVIHDSFDATHEREWRFAGDMQFAWNDVNFIFCPENEFGRFASVQNNAMPCLFDLAWLDRV